MHVAFLEIHQLMSDGRGDINVSGRWSDSSTKPFFGYVAFSSMIPNYFLGSTVRRNLLIYVLFILAVIAAVRLSCSSLRKQTDRTY